MPLITSETDHAFSHLLESHAEAAELHKASKQARRMVFLLGFMLGSSFWALLWAICGDFK